MISPACVPAIVMVSTSRPSLGARERRCPALAFPKLEPASVFPLQKGFHYSDGRWPNTEESLFFSLLWPNTRQGGIRKHWFIWAHSSKWHSPPRWGRHGHQELEAAHHLASRIRERGMLVLNSPSPLYPVSDLSPGDGRWIHLHQWT